jgi:predicted small secreted protein
LEAGDAGNKGKVSAYPTLLLPILIIQNDLTAVQTLVHNKENPKESWKKALAILEQEKYQKTNFKKTFNAYGDNIYFNDPERANIYLGGGATPKNEQSIAYLLRNDALTNIENLKAELEYLLKEDDDIDDLYSYSDIAVGAMKKYMAIVPPNELEEARRILAKS